MIQHLLQSSDPLTPSTCTALEISLISALAFVMVIALLAWPVVSLIIQCRDGWKSDEPIRMVCAFDEYVLSNSSRDQKDGGDSEWTPSLLQEDQGDGGVSGWTPSLMQEESDSWQGWFSGDVRTS